MDDVAGLLHGLGFGDYEARAYVALLQRSPLNGYELAKASGVPRANVYSVLQKLEDRGAVVRLDTPGGTRYAPLPPDELVDRLGTRLQSTLHAAERALKNIAAPAAHNEVWNVQGYAAMLEHARALIDGAEQQLLVATRPQEARALVPNITDAAQRGVAITTLCLAACANECGGCRGNIYRYRVQPDERDGWLVLVPDDAEVLAGAIDPSDEAQAVRTRQRLLVELTGWFIRHSIALAAVLSELGSRLERELSAPTLAVLASVGPGGGWLEHMRGLLNRGETQPNG